MAAPSYNYNNWWCQWAAAGDRHTWWQGEWSWQSWQPPVQSLESDAERWIRTNRTLWKIVLNLKSRGRRTREPEVVADCAEPEDVAEDAVDVEASGEELARDADNNNSLIEHSTAVQMTEAEVLVADRWMSLFLGVEVVQSLRCLQASAKTAAKAEQALEKLGTPPSQRDSPENVSVAYKEVEVRSIPAARRQRRALRDYYIFRVCRENCFFDRAEILRLALRDFGPNSFNNDLRAQLLNAYHCLVSVRPRGGSEATPSNSEMKKRAMRGGPRPGKEKNLQKAAERQRF